MNGVWYAPEPVTFDVMTLSQVGLALRFGVCAATIRRQGNYVNGTSNDGCSETWVRATYSTGRLHGYKRIRAYRPLRRS